MTSFTTSPARRPTIRPPAYKHDGDKETWAAAARWRYFHAPAIGDPAIGIAHRSRGTVVCYTCGGVRVCAGAWSGLA